MVPAGEPGDITDIADHGGGHGRAGAGAAERSAAIATGGPLGLVRDGDVVTIDLDRQVIDLEVPAGEMERRREPFAPPPPSGEKGWLSVYERMVRPLSEGATLRG